MLRKWDHGGPKNQLIFVDFYVAELKLSQIEE